MIDKFDYKLKGEFSIDIIKDGEVIDQFIDRNLVVDGSRAVLASLLSGINRPVPLNKLSLGTMGHNEAFDKFTPKIVGGSYQVGPNNVTFDATRPKLFCHDYEIDSLDLSFNTLGNEEIQQVVPVNVSLGAVDIDTSGSFVEVTCSCNAIIYKFELEQGVGHGLGANSVTAYTEAGLFADNILFAIKTFPAKVKDNATKFIITWKIFT